MPFDKYRNWPLPELQGRIIPLVQGQDLERQVLEDLAATEDEVEKLEILDSYAAYAQRAYQARVAEALSVLVARISQTILRPNVPLYLPAIDIPHRGRMVTKE